MKTEYIREMRESYLQIVSETEANYGMKLLVGNNVPGFLNVMERKINDQSYYLYKISSLICMEDVFLNKSMSIKELESIIKSISKIWDTMDNYLMDYNYIILRPEMIFRDVNCEEWHFTYNSCETGIFNEGLKDLFEYIIKIVNHKDTKAVTMAYGIYKRLCEGNYNPENLFEFELTENEEGEVIKETQIIDSVIPERVVEEVEESDYKKIYMIYGLTIVYGCLVLYLFLGIFFKRIRFGNTGALIYVILLIILGIIGYFAFNWIKQNKSTLVNVTHKQIEIPFEKEKVRVIVPRENKAEDETVFLSNENYLIEHSLVWQDKAGEKRFVINEKTILLGSAADKVDCVISEKGISRIHARITTEGNRFFIKDMNSTNGTAVNGRELACYELCEIKSGDRIKLGNLESIFV